MNVELQGETKYLSLVEEGAALFEKKEYALAAACFWRAFRLRPGAPVVLFNIGRTMEELNDLRCEDFYAAAASQGNVDALYELARLCGASGRHDEAVEHLRAYLKGNPANDSCTQWARHKIQQLCPSPLLVWSKRQRLGEDT
jgi:tetratricopeptide (TPR) repeat protein